MKPKTIKPLSIMNNSKKQEKIWAFMYRISKEQDEQQMKEFSNWKKIDHNAMYTESK